MLYPRRNPQLPHIRSHGKPSEAGRFCGQFRAKERGGRMTLAKIGPIPVAAKGKWRDNRDQLDAARIARPTFIRLEWLSLKP
jgi:hypothetical protein